MRLPWAPKIRLSDSQWTAILNLLTSEGAVEEWHISGTHDEHTQTNCVLNIRRRTLKEKRSYFFPLEGG